MDLRSSSPTAPRTRCSSTPSTATAAWASRSRHRQRGRRRTASRSRLGSKRRSADAARLVERAACHGGRDCGDLTIQSPAMEEAHLVAALRARDEAAFRELIRMYGAGMLRVAQMYVSSRTVAEEV